MKDGNLKAEEKKSLETWIKISNVINSIYYEMASIEYGIGTDNPRYETLKRNLEISLDTESEIKEYWFKDYSRGVKAIKYIRDSDDDRLNILLETDFDMDKIFSKLAYGNETDYFHSFDIRQNEVIEKHIFSSFVNKAYLNLLNEEIALESNNERKLDLIFLKYSLLSCNPECEDIYFNFGRSADAFLLDDEFVSRYLELDIATYRSKKSMFLNDNAYEYMMRLLKSNEPADKDLFSLALSGILSVMSYDEIMSFYDRFETIKEQIPEEKSKFVSRAFSRATKKNEGNTLNLRKFPNN